MLDCRGMACPQPVINTKNILDKESPSEFEVIIDNKAASENVARFMTSKGYTVSIKEQGEDFIVSGQKTGQPAATEELKSPKALDQDLSKQLVFIRSDCIGHGDDKLGKGLMKNFILTLKEMGPDLWRIIFLNGGVKLCCQGSEVIEALKELEQSGVSILVCGTCLDFFNLLEEKQVGQTTNMLDVVTSLQLADKVITA